jgi:hypothetical protein
LIMNSLMLSDQLNPSSCIRVRPSKVRLVADYYSASAPGSRFPWEINLKAGQVYDAVPMGKDTAVVLPPSDREISRKVPLAPHYYQALESGIINSHLSPDRFIAWTFKRAIADPNLIHNLFRSETACNWRSSVSGPYNDAVLVEIAKRRGTGLWSLALDGQLIPIFIKWGVTNQSLSSFCGWVTRDYNQPHLKQELENWESPYRPLPPKDLALAHEYWLNAYRWRDDKRRRSTLSKTLTRLSGAMQECGYEFVEIQLLRLTPLRLTTQLR